MRCPCLEARGCPAEGLHALVLRVAALEAACNTGNVSGQFDMLHIRVAALEASRPAPAQAACLECGGLFVHKAWCHSVVQAAPPAQQPLPGICRTCRRVGDPETCHDPDAEGSCRNWQPQPRSGEGVR